MDLQQRYATHEAGHCVAALAYAIPIVSVSYRQRHDRTCIAGTIIRRMRTSDWNAMVTLCLSGPEAEREFCGPISDNSDRVDYEMAREYLARQLNPLQVGVELVRFRDAAQRLVRSALGRSNAFVCSPMRCCAVAR